MEHTNYAIFGIAFIGGFATLLLVRTFGVDSFNLIYITYVAQMALFPAIWSILHGKLQLHSRGGLAIACGLIAGLLAVSLGLTIQPLLATWAPVIALGVACMLHWPFGKKRFDKVS